MKKRINKKANSKKQSVTREYLDRQDFVTKKYLDEQSFVTKPHLDKVIIEERKFNAKMFKQAEKDRVEMESGLRGLIEENGKKIDRVMGVLKGNSQKTKVTVSKQEIQAHINSNFSSRITGLEELSLAK